MRRGEQASSSAIAMSSSPSLSPLSPPALRCMVAQETEEEDGEEDEDDLSNLRLDDLLAPLQCVICRENATAMYTCVNGHRVCTECLMHHASVESTPRVPCAICRDAFSWNRDMTAKAVMLAIEQGLGGAPFARCDNAGCRRRIGVEELDAHRMHCPFRQVMCPNERCQEHVAAAHLTRHLRQHSETLVMREGQSLTAVVFAFNLDCAIVLEGADHEALAVFHLHTNGIHGTPGVYELEQGVVRACCLHSHDANAAWDVRVTNVDAAGAFDDVETFRAPVEPARPRATAGRSRTLGALQVDLRPCTPRRSSTSATTPPHRSSGCIATAACSGR